MGSTMMGSRRAGLALVLTEVAIPARAEVQVDRLPGPPGCRIIPHGSYRLGAGTVVRGRIARCNLIAIPRRR